MTWTKINLLISVNQQTTGICNQLMIKKREKACGSLTQTALAQECVINFLVHYSLWAMARLKAVQCERNDGSNWKTRSLCICVLAKIMPPLPCSSVYNVWPLAIRNMRPTEWIAVKSKFVQRVTLSFLFCVCAGSHCFPALLFSILLLLILNDNILLTACSFWCLLTNDNSFNMCRHNIISFLYINSVYCT